MLARVAVITLGRASKPIAGGTGVHLKETRVRAGLAAALRLERRRQVEDGTSKQTGDQPARPHDFEQR